MPFRGTVASDISQRKLYSIFPHLENVMIIADDIMVIGYQEDEWDYDIAFTKLLETMKKNNIKLNFNKIQYKWKEVEFLAKLTQHRDVNSVTQKQSHNRDTKASKSERFTDLPRNSTISEQILS